ncbi:MAG: hypothetical protein HWQ35_34530 [Nostoc sp. NMS1]|uniref:hypothetical protein n=1 Tax=unclassified Nostoc TaxID=2593658 RepID=UPI0025D45F7A|nr:MULTISPECIES: hypothetical protein [unclassified Nostoc]MBN3911469.1 hypothetical protein [Nostoc sp. NMS1]MBN3992418.1 hypothetical protein [Nostoc sp. NMS2]
MKLALQRLEVSTSQCIPDGIRDFELLPWRAPGHDCWVRKSGDGGRSDQSQSGVIALVKSKTTHII